MFALSTPPSQYSASVVVMLAVDNSCTSTVTVPNVAVHPLSAFNTSTLYDSDVFTPPSVTSISNGDDAPVSGVPTTLSSLS